MFTTETPLAQEFSMESSAATPPKRRAVANARRHGDDRAVDQSADDAGKRALHPGDGDDGARTHQLVQTGEQTVQPGHADVIQPHDAVSEHLGCERCLLGDGNVARTAGRDDDLSVAVRLRQRPDDADTGGCVIGRALRAPAD